MTTKNSAVRICIIHTRTDGMDRFVIFWIPFKGVWIERYVNNDKDSICGPKKREEQLHVVIKSKQYNQCQTKRI